MNRLPDLIADPRALRVRKRQIPIEVHFAAGEGICDTLEGPVHFRSGDAILTGVRSEKWPIERRRFLAGYTPIAPTVAGQDGRYLKTAGEALALRLDHALKVPVGWQDDPLQANPGDWILRYPDGSHGVIKDEIFRETYGSADNEVRWPPSL